MHFHVSNKLIVTAVIFAAAFISVTFIFVKKPHLVKSKNRIVRAAVIFCIAFVPGVLAATVCAKALTDIYSRVFGAEPSVIVTEEYDDDDDEEEEEEKHSSA